PNITIGNVTTTEPSNGSTSSAVFTVSLAFPSVQNINLQYATADNTAIAGFDYQATNGSFTIAAGQTSGTISVPVLGNGVDEINGTFFVNLSNASHGNIIRSRGTGTIIDSDGPGISANDVTLL